MKIKKNVILRTMADDSMLIPVGDTVFEYNGIFMLSESGKLLWEQIVNGAEKNELTELLMKTYDIDADSAAEDVDGFIDMLKEYGIV